MVVIVFLLLFMEMEQRGSKKWGGIMKGGEGKGQRHRQTSEIFGLGSRSLEQSLYREIKSTLQ